MRGRGSFDCLWLTQDTVEFNSESGISKCQSNEVRFWNPQEYEWDSKYTTHKKNWPYACFIKKLTLMTHSVEKLLAASRLNQYQLIITLLFPLDNEHAWEKNTQQCIKSFIGAFYSSFVLHFWLIKGFVLAITGYVPFFSHIPNPRGIQKGLQTDLFCSVSCAKGRGMTWTSQFTTHSPILSRPTRKQIPLCSVGATSRRACTRL